MALIAAGFAVGAAGACIIKKLETNEERRKLAESVKESLPEARRKGVSPYDCFFRDASLQQVLAMLVDGVYYRDHEAKDFPIVVKPLLEGEYLVDERVVHFTELHWTRMPCISEDEERDVGLKHYLRKDSNPNRSAPCLVIAIRGTKLSSCQDLVDDIGIARHTLHFSNRFEKCQNLIEKIISEFRKLQQRYNYLPSPATDIYITGHSLGAAMALQIGKHLAAVRNEWHSVHCFNPPFLTIVQLTQKFLLVEKSKELLHKLHLKPILDGIAHVKDTAKLAAAWVLGDADQLLQELQHFVSLKDWVPVLYVNAHDRICKKFLQYYQRKHGTAVVPICSQAMLSRALGRNAKYSSLVPSVNMVISKRQDHPHALKNWHTGHPPPPHFLHHPELEYQEFRLLGLHLPLSDDLLGVVLQRIMVQAQKVQAPRISDHFDHSDSDSDSECIDDYTHQGYGHAYGQSSHYIDDFARQQGSEIAEARQTRQSYY